MHSHIFAYCLFMHTHGAHMHMLLILSSSFTHSLSVSLCRCRCRCRCRCLCRCRCRCRCLSVCLSLSLPPSLLLPAPPRLYYGGSAGATAPSILAIKGGPERHVTMPLRLLRVRGIRPGMAERCFAASTFSKTYVTCLAFEH